MMDELRFPNGLSADVLADMDLFDGVSEAALVEIGTCASVRQLSKQTIVFVQGETASRCHAVLAGSVRITQYDENGGQLVVRFIAPGEIFGAVALFTDGKYPAEAVAITDSVEISWTESVIRDLMERHPRIAINMLKVLGARIREVQERLRELATQRVECRIARVLLRLAAQAGHIEGLGTKIDFPLTRKDVADMCGTTLHTVSRVLAGWEKAGLIASGRQRVTISQSEKIRQIAEDLPN